MDAQNIDLFSPPSPPPEVRAGMDVIFGILCINVSTFDIYLLFPFLSNVHAVTGGIRDVKASFYFKRNFSLSPFSCFTFYLFFLPTHWVIPRSVRP